MLLTALLAWIVAFAPAHADSRALEAARALGDAFAGIAERVGPATVYIQADKAQPLSMGLQQLFQEYALPSPEGEAPAWSTSSGSGVIVRPDGLLLTNHHVVNGATALRVTLWDKRSYPATLVGGDPRTDIAVLKIQGEGPFPVAPIGDSDSLRVGHWVLAVGHPFDFQFTVTAGVVSARGRRNIIREEIQDYIQTDAAVNPGSSGGPLFDLDGRLVGINTAIYTPEGGAVQHAGISFAIPSNMAWRIAQEVMGSGRVARASIGIATRDAPPSPEHPRPGAEITQIIAEGPAERAGLRRGDIILAVGGEPIGGSEDLRGLVLARGPGVPLRITFERGGEERNVELTTGSSDQVGTADRTIPAEATHWAGMVLVPSTESWLAEFGVSLPAQQAPGLLVLTVEPGSPGAVAGLAPGDVLLRVHREEIPDGERLLKAVEGRRSALVWFWRGGGQSLAAVGGL